MEYFCFQEPKKQCLSTKSSTTVPRIEKHKPEMVVPLEPAIGDNLFLLFNVACNNNISTLGDMHTICFEWW